MHRPQFIAFYSNCSVFSRPAIFITNLLKTGTVKNCQNLPHRSRCAACEAKDLRPAISVALWGFDQSLFKSAFMTLRDNNDMNEPVKPARTPISKLRIDNP